MVAITYNEQQKLRDIAASKDGKVLETSLLLLRDSTTAETVKLLIELGADIDVADAEDKLTPLGLAILTDNMEAAEALIDAGAAMTIYKGARSPIVFAVRKNKPDMLKLLVKRGADINAPSFNEHSALVTALLDGNERMIRLVRSLGGSAKVTRDDGLSSLHCIVQRPEGTEDHVKTLVSWGADVHAVSIDGLTPLHCLAVMPEMPFIEEKIRMLVKLGADINARDAVGGTPLSLAKEPETIRALIKMGADLLAEDETGYLAGTNALHALPIKEGELLLTRIGEEKAAKLKQHAFLLNTITAASLDTNRVAKILKAYTKQVAILDNQHNTVFHKLAYTKNFVAFRVLSRVKSSEKFCLKTNKEGKTALDMVITKEFRQGNLVVPDDRPEDTSHSVAMIAALIVGVALRQRRKMNWDNALLESVKGRIVRPDLMFEALYLPDQLLKHATQRFLEIGRRSELPEVRFVSLRKQCYFSIILC